MSVSCGFFNSKDHDRLYDALDFSTFMNGFVTNGVYATVGESFAVSRAYDSTVIISPLNSK